MDNEEVKLDENKLKAIEVTVNLIEKQFGKGSIMLLGDEKLKVDVDVIPSGSIGLDIATGIGGLPRGRVVEIFGPESAGKTTLALEAVVQAQKLGGLCSYIDIEHALDMEYAKVLGIDTRSLMISQPDTGEQALDIAETLTKSGNIDLIVIDSVAALVPQQELDGAMGDTHIALLARLMSQALRKLVGNVHKSKTCIVFVNQIRENVGIMYGAVSGQTTPGGHALKFHASLRIEIKKIGSLKKGEEYIGLRTRVKVVKNKLAAPFRSADFDLIFGKGISKIGEIVDLAVKRGVIIKSGSWFSFENKNISQGREGAIDILAQDTDLYTRIHNAVIETIVE